ncbi:Vesicle transport through interaction with t-SNAREs-like 1B [Hondaea fermentalgiana]|uniref:Vesicle transport through interaction with t-SNAREs-like 1B n=1 Tax=Hondaea fermentalgiana TaxID=2315210 RepID=A0A2R5GUN3_9STRA|nr:Vesicle transport through interaction with t-SNAREs-like 1B [Hondaea fermentalgiana]|eukprot:GBG34275.1 Vesicle transport through interaction with t-SNAREs-like 1B [Hondaea fermentalgiana]
MLGLYEGEVTSLLKKVRDALDDVLEAGTGADADPKVLEDLQGDFSRLSQAIKQLETEARTQPDATSRKALQSKVRQFKDDVKGLQSRYNGIFEASKRAYLTSSGATGARSGNAQERERMLNVNQRMEDGTRKLQDSHRTMLEIEETAQSVAEQLQDNRASLESTRRKLQDTNSLTGQARGLLRKMEHNERVKKLVGYGAFGIVVICMLFLVYSIVF